MFCYDFCTRARRDRICGDADCQLHANPDDGNDDDDESKTTTTAINRRRSKRYSLLGDEEELVDRVPHQEDGRHVLEGGAVETKRDQHDEEEHVHRLPELEGQLLTDKGSPPKTALVQPRRRHGGKQKTDEKTNKEGRAICERRARGPHLCSWARSFPRVLGGRGVGAIFPSLAPPFLHIHPTISVGRQASAKRVYRMCPARVTSSTPLLAVRKGKLRAELGTPARARRGM